MKIKLLRLSLFCFVTTFVSDSFAQNIEVNTTWLVTGNAQQSLEGFGIDSTRMVFNENNVFEIKYYQNGSSITETSTWTQVNTNRFDITTDENGPVVGSSCPGAVFELTYTIVEDLLTISEVQSNTTCSGIDMLLTGSSWVNEAVYLSSLQVINEENLFYPNPATEFVTVRSDKLDKNVRVSFLSSTGAIVSVDKIDEFTYDLSKLSKGLYFLIFSSDNGVAPLGRPIIVQ